MNDSPGTGPAPLHVTEVDGVPTFWADVPGPLTAGLLVRVGFADETLPTRGHSHMLEHLALFGLGRPGEHSNGQVDATAMLLHTAGTPEDVTTFFERVCRQLVDPPVDRLEDEKGVLRAEATRRGSHPFTELGIWRWGMRDYGLESADEMGLSAITAESIREWSRTWIGRRNSALWLSGPPPAGLTLPLPEGEYRPAPDPKRRAIAALPAYFRSQAPHVALHGLLDRDWTGPALARTVNNRLVDELRTTRASAYAPQAGYRPLDGQTSALMVMSDIVEGRGQEVVERVLTIVGDLAGPAGIARQEEIDAHREATLAGMQNSSTSNPPPSAAWDVLHGKPVLNADEIREGLAQLTPDGLAEAARSASGTLLAQVPNDTPVPDGWEHAPISAAYPVRGRVFEHRDRPSILVVGPEGVSLHEAGNILTVHHRATAAVGAWTDGGRVLIGDDGLRVAIEPTLWRRGKDLAIEVDGVVDWNGRVDLGDRPAASIPRPMPLMSRLGRDWRKILAVTVGVIAVVVVSLIAIATGYTSIGPVAGVGGALLLRHFMMRAGDTGN